jgi:hypothetical protein
LHGAAVQKQTAAIHADAVGVVLPRQDGVVEGEPVDSF